MIMTMKYIKFEYLGFMEYIFQHFLLISGQTWYIIWSLSTYDTEHIWCIVVYTFYMDRRNGWIV